MRVEVKHDIKQIDIFNTPMSFVLSEIRDYVEYDDITLNPFLLENMDVGINLLKKHLDNDSKIFLQVDSDVDGLTSAAVIYLYIKKIKPSAKIEYRMHTDKSHGLINGTVPKDIGLIILPDSSSNQYELHEIYFNLGIDILVLDHHMAERKSKYACVINNQLSENYSNKDLSGVGVVYKFCEAFSKTFLEHSPEEEFLDLVAIGLIADLMYINNSENMKYISKGLKNINQPAIKELIAKQAFMLGGKDIGIIDISFNIAPYYNAVFRVGTDEEKEMMFESFINPHKVIETTKKGFQGNTITIAEEYARICTNIKNKQKAIIDKGLEYLVLKIMNNKKLLSNKVLLIEVSKHAMPRELTGLIAMKLLSTYGKPTIILMEDKRGNYSGSCRAFPTEQIMSFKNYCASRPEVIFAEGHDSAFGLSFKSKEDIANFIEYSNSYIDDSSVGLIQADFAIKPELITLDLAEKIDSFSEMYGRGYQAPLFYIESITFNSKNVDYLGADETTVKIKYGDLTFIKFKDSNLKKILQENTITTLEIVGEIKINEWAGEKNCQFLIQTYDKKKTAYRF